MSKAKKIIAIIVCVFCIFATFFVPVSALVSNGAIITGLSSSYIRMNNTTDYYSPTVTQNGYTIRNSYQISGVITNLIDTYNRLEFKSTNNYGLLKMSVYSDSGSPYHSESSVINWNGLYNSDTDVKLASAFVEADSFSVIYEGYIPTHIEFRGYFTVESSADVLQSFVVCNIEFFPLTDPNIATNDDIIANQDKNTDKITQNNDKNTDKIINNQNQLQENEKIEANQGGSDNVDSVIDAIPADNDGIISAFSKLANAVSYNGTEAILEIPQIYIPSISNIVPRINLVDKTDFDLGSYVNMLPDSILSLIQTLSTIALIIYCCKELYDQIEYVLTMRKGGAYNE